MIKDKLLIVGLGNPGKKYASTPHNAGFAVIDELIEKLREHNVRHKEKNTKNFALWDAPELEGKQVAFVKPLTFMNNSGDVVSFLAKSYKLKAISSQLWLIYDDIDIPMGKIRVRTGGASGGHKGVRDVIEKAGSKEFMRFRIGVLPSNMPQRRPAQFMNEYVTKKLKRKERKILEKSVEKCAALVEQAIDNGPESVLGDHRVD